MGRPLTIRSLIFAWMLTGGLITIAGQSPFTPLHKPEAFLIRDRLEVFTDRNIYVVGESILFKGNHHQEGIQEGSSWSTVLYAELVASSGNVISTGKYRIEAGYSSGRLDIPQGAITGNYYLKCYTRWMRNAGPKAYSYTPLKIINPFKSDVVEQGNGNVKNSSTDRREYLYGYMECITDKSRYQRGDEVSVRLSMNPEFLTESLSSCVTVVPAGGIDTASGQMAYAGSPIDPQDYVVDFLPDMDGISLSGTLINPEHGDQPIPSARIHFSLLGDHPDYLAMVTDENGRFTVSTPDRKGMQEIFVAIDPSIAEQARVRVDQDFDAEGVPFMMDEFSLSYDERNLATRLALQKQLKTIYGPKSGGVLSARSEADSRNIPFYGTPGFTILMDDFVTLPNLEEVFVNLVPDVMVQVRRGQRTLSVIGPNSAIKLYPPLILIDHIPVFDHQAILGIHPEKILKVDVINEVYLKGSVEHGGIVSIFSRDGDLAGIDLSSNSYFFDFQSAQSANPEVIKKYEPGDRIPDVRNTVFWLDHLLLTIDGPRSISFNAPLNPGEYQILVRGMAYPGNVISATARFIVD